VESMATGVRGHLAELDTLVRPADEVIATPGEAPPAEESPPADDEPRPGVDQLAL
jgi:hypothetical protein